MGNIFTRPTMVQSDISLAEYAYIIGYSECAFFGVFKEETYVDYACRDIWLQEQRDEVAFYLAEAQDEIERVTGYPLVSKWISAEEQTYKPVIQTRKGYVSELGIQATDVLVAAVALDRTVDPSVVTISPSPVSTVDDIYVYYPGTDIKIIPSNVKISAGDLIITIPRCRAVAYTKLYNPASGLVHSDNANFQATVDVKRHYTDSTSQIDLAYFEHCPDPPCEESLDTACGRIEVSSIGRIGIIPASYDGGWTYAGSRCRKAYFKLYVSYRAGPTEMSREAQNAVIRLAHAKMPNEPCGCDIIQRMWERDRAIPEAMTQERLECPFGLNDGAWVAWMFANNIALVRDGV